MLQKALVFGKCWSSSTFTLWNVSRVHIFFCKTISVAFLGGLAPVCHLSCLAWLPEQGLYSPLVKPLTMFELQHPHCFMFRAMQRTSSCPKFLAFNKQTCLCDLSVEPSHFLAWHPKPDELSFKSRISSSSWLYRWVLNVGCDNSCTIARLHWFSWKPEGETHWWKDKRWCFCRSGCKSSYSSSQLFFLSHETIPHRSLSFWMLCDFTQHRIHPKTSGVFSKAFDRRSHFAFQIQMSDWLQLIYICTSKTSWLFLGNPEWRQHGRRLTRSASGH